MAREGKKNKRGREPRRAPYSGDRENKTDEATDGKIVRFISDERREPMLFRGPETMMVTAYVQCLTCMDKGDTTQWEGIGTNKVMATSSLQQEHVDCGHALLPNGKIHFTEPRLVRTDRTSQRLKVNGSLQPVREEMVVTASVHCVRCAELRQPSRHQATEPNAELAISALYQVHAESVREQNGGSHALACEADIIVSEPHPRPLHLVNL